MKKKLAFATADLAIAIGLVALIVIFAIGMFTNGLNGLIANGNIKTFFSNSDQKVGFERYKRDYTSSQAEVQVTGAQGLEMLRKKANNLALELADSQAATKANEIAYLSKVVEAISGQSHFCAYMNENSDNHCDEFANKKYAYKTNISSTLTMNKVGQATNTYPLKKEVSSILNAKMIPKVDDERPNFASVEEQYQYIIELSQELNSYIDSSVFVLNLNNVRNNVSSETKAFSTSDFDELISAYKNAHEKCTGHTLLFKKDTDVPSMFADSDRCGRTWKGMISSQSNKFVNKSEISEMKKIIDSITSKEAMMNQLTSNSRLVELAKQDNYNSPSSCEILKNIAKGYDVNLECVPNSSN